MKIRREERQKMYAIYCLSFAWRATKQSNFELTYITVHGYFTTIADTKYIPDIKMVYLFGVCLYFFFSSLVSFNSPISFSHTSAYSRFWFYKARNCMCRNNLFVLFIYVLFFCSFKLPHNQRVNEGMNAQVYFVNVFIFFCWFMVLYLIWIVKKRRHWQSSGDKPTNCNVFRFACVCRTEE